MCRNFVGMLVGAKEDAEHPQSVFGRAPDCLKDKLNLGTKNAFFQAPILVVIYTARPKKKKKMPLRVGVEVTFNALIL